MVIRCMRIARKSERPLLAENVVKQQSSRTSVRILRRPRQKVILRSNLKWSLKLQFSASRAQFPQINQELGCLGLPGMASWSAHVSCFHSDPFSSTNGCLASRMRILWLDLEIGKHRIYRLNWRWELKKLQASCAQSERLGWIMSPRRGDCFHPTTLSYHGECIYCRTLGMGLYTIDFD